MPKVKYHVRLSPEEQKTLLDLVSKGTATARVIIRANVLLATDENKPSGKKSEMEIACKPTNGTCHSEEICSRRSICRN